MWGCDAPPQKGYEVTIDGEELGRCPNRPLLDDGAFLGQAFTFYNWYSKGEFPEAGTWRDQPNAFIELMAIMDSANNDAEAMLKERDETKRLFYDKMQQGNGN